VRVRERERNSKKNNNVRTHPRTKRHAIVCDFRVERHAPSCSYETRRFISLPFGLLLSKLGESRETDINIHAGRLIISSLHNQIKINGKSTPFARLGKLVSSRKREILEFRYFSRKKECSSMPVDRKETNN